jgi:predicted PhzF superfamily epimerase YddE/YHI9
VDFVSRYFSPWNGIPEDPVNGSSHTNLAPLWSKILGKVELRAKMVSNRGGDLFLKGKLLFSSIFLLFQSGKMKL